MTLYEELSGAGVPMDNHESDLYFKVTEESMAILKRHPAEFKVAKSFLDAETSRFWAEVPFAYDPFWPKR